MILNAVIDRRLANKPIKPGKITNLEHSDRASRGFERALSPHAFTRPHSVTFNTNRSARIFQSPDTFNSDALLPGRLNPIRSCLNSPRDKTAAIAEN